MIPPKKIFPYKQTNSSKPGVPELDFEVIKKFVYLKSFLMALFGIDVINPLFTFYDVQVLLLSYKWKFSLRLFLNAVIKTFFSIPHQ